MTQTAHRPSTPVSARTPCPVCQSPKRCLIGEYDILCYRTAEGARTTKHDRHGNPVYIHRRADAPPVTNGHAPPLPTPSRTRADLDTLDAAYSLLVKRSIISIGTGSHMSALMARGFNLDSVKRLGYGTHRLVGRAAKAREIREKIGDALLNVPGFVVKTGDRGEYLSIAGKPGLLLPVRALGGRIQAMQIRVDDNDGSGKYRYLSSAKAGGPGPGSPVHVPLGVVGPVDRVRVTEGTFKADIAFLLSKLPTIGLSGVGTWRMAVTILRELEAKTVVLAFDGDAATNPEVARHLLAFAHQLMAEGFAVEVERWPADAGKGIDDVLAAGKGDSITVVVGDAVVTEIEDMATAAGVDLDAPAAPEKPVFDGPNEAVEDPHRLARVYRAKEGMRGGDAILHYWRDEWQRYENGAYRPVPDPEIRAALTRTAKAEFDAENMAALEKWIPDDKNPDPPVARKVTTGVVTNMRQALASTTVLSGSIEQPAWLDEPPEGMAADEMLATASGILHLPSLIAGRPALVPPTPLFFSPNCVPYEFNAQAECPEWLKFLDSIWSDDRQSIDTLGEWFGYNLLPDLSHHKIAMVIGPRRSGKGTIVRTLKRVIGAGNVASPTLASLAGPFGLWPLLNKTAALIADARLSGRTDAVAVVERLLSISGEDPQDVHRKNLPTLTGIRLPVRFTILSNELPNVRDASGAMTSRIVMFRMTRSFLGSEDKALGDRLGAELSGILRWAITGWQRLRERGAFVQPDSARELLEDLDNLASPITQFVAERCNVGDAYEVSVDDLYGAWKSWCEKHGRDNHGTRETFGKDLRAALPQLKGTQPRRDDGSRYRAYEGIDIKP